MFGAGIVPGHINIPVGVVVEIHTAGLVLRSNRQSAHSQVSSECPMVAPYPEVALAAQDSLSHCYHCLLTPQQFQPTIVPSFGHVPSLCQYAPLSSPDVET